MQGAAEVPEPKGSFRNPIQFLPALNGPDRRSCHVSKLFLGESCHTPCVVHPAVCVVGKVPGHLCRDLCDFPSLHASFFRPLPGIVLWRLPGGLLCICLSAIRVCCFPCTVFHLVFLVPLFSLLILFHSFLSPFSSAEDSPVPLKDPVRFLRFLSASCRRACLNEAHYGAEPFFRCGSCRRISRFWQIFATRDRWCVLFRFCMPFPCGREGRKTSFCSSSCRAIRFPPVPQTPSRKV